MNNKDLANVISGKKSKSDTTTSISMKNAMYNAALKAANQKDADFKKHEQNLLWAVEAILDEVVLDGEARNKVLNEFKERLINKFD